MGPAQEEFLNAFKCALATVDWHVSLCDALAFAVSVLSLTSESLLCLSAKSPLLSLTAAAVSVLSPLLSGPVLTVRL